MKGMLCNTIKRRRQPNTFGVSRVWVLLNPSGPNRGFRIDMLAEAYTAFR